MPPFCKKGRNTDKAVKGCECKAIHVQMFIEGGVHDANGNDEMFASHLLRIGIGGMRHNLGSAGDIF